jgi:integrase
MRFQQSPSTEPRTGQTDGGPLSHGVVQDALDRVCEQAGVPRVTPHQLRHMTASLLAAMKMTLLQIQHVLRHKSQSLTSDLYSHLLEETGREVADRMDDLAP